MAPHHEPDDERPQGGPPLPPEDRLWRHPSELGAVAGAAPATGPGSAVADLSNRRTSARAAITGACMAGALVTLGVLLLTRPFPDGDLRRTPALRRTGTSVAAVTTLTAPVASAAAPIQRAQAVPLVAPSDAGRLRIQVNDDGGPVIVVTVDPEGPAHRAGLAEGDHILSIDGTAVHDAGDLLDVLGLTSSGDPATLVIARDGGELVLPVVLG